LSAGSKQQQKWVKSFVPPAPPAAAPAAVIEETPDLDPRVFARELPMLLAPVPSPVQNVEAENRLRLAESMFLRGRELAVKGDIEAARIEFDNALEEISGAPPTMPERARLLARYQTLVNEIHSLDKEAAIAPPDPAQPQFDRSPVDEIAEQTFEVEPSLKGKVKNQLRSTVSQLPLEIEDPVLGFINYFSSPRGQQIVAAGTRRSGRYAPMIRRILDEEGLPPELIYLAQAESGFLPRAVSYKAATGMWQFVQFRGREYGLNQTAYTDDRLDPEKATRAAARHLRDLYKDFGDWYLAVAAYNCGPVAVERGIQRTGHADFWELYRRNVLPRETANYLPIILALTIMSKNPKEYGLDGIVTDAPLEYDTIRLEANTHLALVAEVAGRPLTDLQALNPAVLRLIAPGGYEIHVPKGMGRTVLARLHHVPVERRATWRVHRVEPGQNLAYISRQYNIRESQLLDANQNLAADASPFEPEAGDLILVPVSYPGGPEDRPRRPAATRRPAKSGKAKTPVSSRPAPVRKRPQQTAVRQVSSAKPAAARTIASNRLPRR
jgi:membrane-bound lytic murein transglycosylase D